jgi:hypothetical protein
LFSGVGPHPLSDGQIRPEVFRIRPVSIKPRCGGLDSVAGDFKPVAWSRSSGLHPGGARQQASGFIKPR